MARVEQPVPETLRVSLADEARERSKAAQLRRHPDRAPVVQPSARGASMILLTAASKSDRAAYALLFRQLLQIARAICEMHRATDDLRRVQGLSAAVVARRQSRRGQGYG